MDEEFTESQLEFLEAADAGFYAFESNKFQKAVYGSLASTGVAALVASIYVDKLWEGDTGDALSSVLAVGGGLTTVCGSLALFGVTAGYKIKEQLHNMRHPIDRPTQFNREN